MIRATGYSPHGSHSDGKQRREPEASGCRSSVSRRIPDFEQEIRRSGGSQVGSRVIRATGYSPHGSHCGGKQRREPEASGCRSSVSRRIPDFEQEIRRSGGSQVGSRVIRATGYSPHGSHTDVKQRRESGRAFSLLQPAKNVFYPFVLLFKVTHHRPGAVTRACHAAFNFEQEIRRSGGSQVGSRVIRATGYSPHGSHTDVKQRRESGRAFSLLQPTKNVFYPFVLLFKVTHHRPGAVTRACHAAFLTLNRRSEGQEAVRWDLG